MRARKRHESPRIRSARRDRSTRREARDHAASARRIAHERDRGRDGKHDSRRDDRVRARLRRVRGVEHAHPGQRRSREDQPLERNWRTSTHVAG
jgi:hypothetical protein